VYIFILTYSLAHFFFGLSGEFLTFFTGAMFTPKTRLRINQSRALYSLGCGQLGAPAPAAHAQSLFSKYLLTETFSTQ
jgi:hypothetical protein